MRSPVGLMFVSSSASLVLRIGGLDDGVIVTARQEYGTGLSEMVALLEYMIRSN